MQYEIKLLNEQISKRGKVDPRLLYVVADGVLDKEFSIQRKYMTDEFGRSPEFRMMRDITAISILLEAKTVNNRTNRVEKNWVFRQWIFNDEFLEYFDDKTKGSEANMGSMLDFIFSDDRYYYRGSLGFKYGVRKLIGNLLHEFKPKTLDFSKELGRTFEVNHILKKLKELESFGFRFYEGIKPPSDRAKIKGYDIDLVMHDVDEDIYYFVQVHYKLSWLPTYFSERVKYFNDDSKAGIKRKYDSQLKIFRDNIMDESIRKRIKDKPYSGAVASNSHYIFLSNQPFLNFYKSDGILFYEWNTFRNILKKGQVIMKTDNGPVELDLGEKLPLHDPDYIVGKYINSSILSKETKTLFDLYRKTFCEFSVCGKSITYPLI